MTTVTSIVIAATDPQPVCEMSGDMPAIRFGHDTLLLLMPDVDPHYLREFAASLLHLASLAERADVQVTA